MDSAKQIRFQWVDIAKGIAILSVVLLHVNYQFYENKCLPLTALLGGLWHVPVFFVLGGFFLKEERLIHPISFITGKIKSLYKLLLYFYIPAVLLHNVMINIGFYSTSTIYGGKAMITYGVAKTLKELVLSVFLAGREPILGAMWFVYVLFIALFCLSITSWGLNQFLKGIKYEYARAILLLFICMMSCMLTNFFDITIPRFNNSLTAMWLIYCGYMLKNKFNLIFQNKYICMASFLIIYHIATNSGMVLLNSNKYSDVVSLTASSISALYVICYFSRKIESFKVGQLLALCGKDSFYIMGLHFVGFKIGTYILAYLGIHRDLSELTAPAGNSFLLLVFYWLFAITFSLCFMALFRKIKKLLCFVYGRNRKTSMRIDSKHSKIGY